jgi:hypothetical protein
VGSDEEIREQVGAWSTLAPITQENLAGEVGGFGIDGIIAEWH